MSASSGSCEPPHGVERTTGVHGRAGLVAVLAGVLLLATVVVSKAWVTDDAYITFRSVQNFVEGRGLTWNPAERVQVFTHPLWMLSISAVYAATGEFFYSSLTLNLAFTLAAASLLAFRLASSWQAACLGVALLTVSRAFTDFSTSGLENPLTHFLLVLLLLLDRRDASRSAPLLRFSLVAALCLLTRLDTLLLLLPAWAAFVWRTGLRRAMPVVLVGVSPLILWESFSLLYYGSFLPNSAYAKLNTGIPLGELALQGVRYLLNSLYWDPVTLVVTLLGAGWAAAAVRSRTQSDRDSPAAPWAWAGGVALSLLYVVRVGGDFMSGRFLTASFVVGLGLLVSRPLRPRLALGAAVASLLLLLVPWTTPFRERDYGSEWHAAIDQHGIADERTFYLDSGSLRASWGQTAWPDRRAYGEARWLHRNWPYDNFARDMLQIGELRPGDGWPPATPYDEAGRPYRKVFPRGAVGFLGYHLGPGAHVLDYHAICDPLLSHLPADVPDPILTRLIPRLADNGWRVGHYYRRPPLGYTRTLATDRNVIRNPALASYYDVIRRITRDPVFDRERLKTLIKLQLGAYDDLLRQARETGY